MWYEFYIIQVAVSIFFVLWLYIGHRQRRGTVIFSIIFLSVARSFFFGYATSDIFYELLMVPLVYYLFYGERILVVISALLIIIISVFNVVNSVSITAVFYIVQTIALFIFNALSSDGYLF